MTKTQGANTMKDNYITWKKRAETAEAKVKKLTEGTIQDTFLLLVADAALDYYGLSDDHHKDLNRIVERIKAPIEAQLTAVVEAAQKVCDISIPFDIAVIREATITLGSILSNLPTTGETLLVELNSLRYQHKVNSKSMQASYTDEKKLRKRITKLCNAGKALLEKIKKYDELKAKNELLRKALEKAPPKLVSVYNYEKWKEDWCDPALFANEKPQEEDPSSCPDCGWKGEWREYFNPDYLSESRIGQLQHKIKGEWQWCAGWKDKTPTPCDGCGQILNRPYESGYWAPKVIRGRKTGGFIHKHRKTWVPCPGKPGEPTSSPKLWGS